MTRESLAVLIVEAGRAKVCRFNVELRGETLWTTKREDLARRVARAKPDIIAVAGSVEAAAQLADDLRQTGLVESVFLITPTADDEPAEPGQVRVVLPKGTKQVKPEGLLQRLFSAVLSAQARSPVSPLTGLPGSRVLRQEVEHRLATGEPFIFLYLDLDNFKAYNDVYGFGRGDIAIRLLSRQVVAATNTFGGPSDSCFHIGGDDFAIVTTDLHYAEIAQHVITDFDRRAPDLYSPKDRTRGYIESPSRRGEPAHYPLMTLSIGGVNTALRRIAGYLHLAEIAAEVKSYAKALEGSQFVMDRRRD
ncbi:MAG: GGDEF domain-containing protein [Armatimonadota bacterium]|nr:MAG: GGDEF domain-containing protein [Armatimonadota bacterium]